MVEKKITSNSKNVKINIIIIVLGSNKLKMKLKLISIGGYPDNWLKKTNGIPFKFSECDENYTTLEKF